MTYTLYTDKSTTFECKIDLDGASLKETMVRLVVDAGSRKLMFTGTITNEGLCTIPISKLRGMLDEHTTGNMSLEVISEDTYFQPWSSPFTVLPSKKLTVEVAQTAPVEKPKMKVQVTTPTYAPVSKPVVTPTHRFISEVVTGLRKKGIGVANVVKNKDIVRQAISEHMMEQDIDTLIEIDGEQIISGVVKMLAQR